MALAVLIFSDGFDLGMIDELTGSVTLFVVPVEPLAILSMFMRG